MPKKVFLLLTSLFLIILLASITLITRKSPTNKPPSNSKENNTQQQKLPIFIDSLRLGTYPGSNIKIEETLEPGSNYNRYIASYQSEGFKIYGLLTIPSSDKPKSGYPFIVFLHGYIPPSQYQTTDRYVAYQDGFAKNGFITYKIDLRGHGNSEGQPVNSHFSQAYVVDTLNAIASLKKYPQADPALIGIWGHSNGGEIGLKTMVVSKEIDAAVFWAGVVGSSQGMLETYNKDIPFLNLDKETPDLVKQYGLPSQNPKFWQQLDPYTYLKDIGGPIQLHHGTADESVPIELSIQLKEALDKANKKVELYQYPNADHNLTNPAFDPAMERSVQFFKQHLSS